MKPYLPHSAFLRPLGFLGLLCTLLLGCGDFSLGNSRAAMDLPENVGDWVRTEAPITYDRETIFDYINGAGEVYRSYAFKDVLVGRYEKTGGPILNVELFDMGTPEDAYGVFSYARENENPGIGSAYESRGSVLCFWQDRFYVCVVTEGGSGDQGGVLEEMARGLSAGLPPAGDRPGLVDALPPEGLVAQSQRFFHTHQSLNYHYYLVRENVLNLTQETDAVLGRYRPGPSYVLIVDYGDEGEAARALASFREQILPGAGFAETVEAADGKFMSSIHLDRFVVVVLDAVSESVAEELRSTAAERLTQLSR